MRTLAALLAVVAVIVHGTEGSKDSNFIMYGPHGEVADQDTPYIWVEDDNGWPQKGYLTPPTNLSMADSTSDMLKEHVRFYLWTRATKSTDGERLFVGDNDMLHASKYNPAHHTKIVIHGFTNTIKSPAITDPKDAYMTRGEFNVIGVDWGDMCGAPWYGTAKDNTIPVGNYVGEMIKFLVQEGGAKLEDIHVIGHSLGAHVSGIAGASLGGNGKVARVTGLDPAGPLFYTAPPEERLDPDDAKFVDAIHTCGGYSFPQLGLMLPTAMADFYPNGGVNMQPGCESLISVFGITCSHSKAYKLWSESVIHPNHAKFRAFGCESFQQVERGCSSLSDTLMGEDANESLRGLFWLATK